MQISDQILFANKKILQRMLKHRFVTDIHKDRLPLPVFHRYLVYEGAFVRTAISIFSYATARAPDLASQRTLISILDALANKQVPYFEKTIGKLSIPIPRKLPKAVIAFDNEMLDLSRDGSFIDIVTAMFAAEWMYWTWCSTASKCQITDPDLKAWIDLHAASEFSAQAYWLKGRIDVYGKQSSAEHLSEIFDRVIHLEMAFHSAAYETSTKKG